MTITVYTRPGCSPCKLTIRKFEAAGPTPQGVDISAAETTMDCISNELGYAQAPVVVYDKTVPKITGQD